MPALAFRSTLPRPDDPDIYTRVANAVRQGHPIDTAARLAGLGRTTARDWLNAGRAILDDHPDKSPGELGSHAVFADAINAAEAEMVEAKLAEVNRDAAIPGKGWTAAMTLLERRRPQDFGRYNRVEVTQERTTTLRIELSSEAAQALGAAQERLALPEGRETP